MRSDEKQARLVLGALLAALVVPVMLVVAVLVGTSGADVAEPAVRPPKEPASVATSGRSVDRPSPIESNRNPLTMLEQHQGMMDQMRASAAPGMVALMDGDPMWQMMRSGEYITLLVQHENEVAKMLAQGG